MTESPWQAYHLFYEQPWERAVLEVVAPVAIRLLEEAAIDRFFYIRYELGGRHVRLRLRVRSDGSERVQEAVFRAAESLFRREPSSRATDDEVIRRRNRVILASDPAETDDRVYPDNSCHRASFVQESSRYGGPRSWAASLDFFCASSLEAIALLELLRPPVPRSRLLAAALRRQIRQTWGFACKAKELRSLLRYGVAGWGPSLPGVIDLADRQFDQRCSALCELFASELETLAQLEPLGAVDDEEMSGVQPGEPGWIAAAAYRLAGEIPAGSARGHGDPRWELGASHLHMTANRVGLGNSEEVYLSRLADRALEHLERQEPALLARVDQVLRERVPAQSGSLELWLAKALERSSRSSTALN